MLDDRLEEARGRPRAHQLVDGGQVQPELVVPDLVHAGVVFAAEPPEPIAALGDEDLPPGKRSVVRLLWSLEQLVLQPRASFGEQVPRDVVLRVTDPRIEARADPAARMQVVQLLLGWMLLGEVGDGGISEVL